MARQKRARFTDSELAANAGTSDDVGGAAAQDLGADDIFVFSNDSDTLSYEAFQLGDDAKEASTEDVPDHNGSGDTTVAVAASGNQIIDGLLRNIRWADGNISYSDPDAAADYGGSYSSDDDGDGISAQNDGFSQFTAQQLRAVHFGLNADVVTQPAGASGFAVEAFTNLIISYAGSGSGAGTIRVANSTDPRAPGNTAYGFYPSASVVGGDSWYDQSGTAPTIGNYDWATVIHELGHNLGLKHGHDTSVFGALPAAMDSMEYSVMTYRSFIGDNPNDGYNNETWGYAQTYMMADIAALQYMYGADFTSNGGDTVYTWNPTNGQSLINGVVALDPGGNRIFSTIWDGNGTDTYDLSNYTTSLRIDLRPGEHSTFSAVQLANLGGGPNGGFARGNVFNALQFNGDARSLIENAIGGSAADTFVGNAADNTFTGRGGDDTIDGAAGTDSAVFAGQRSAYQLIDLGSGSVRVSGPADTDTLSNVERLVFDDQTVTWPPAGTFTTERSDRADGTYVITYTDGANTFDWAVIRDEYTPSGQRDIERILDDDGERHDIFWDVSNTQSWSMVIDNFDPAGQRTSQQVVEDNGSQHTQYWDIPNLFLWSEAIDYQDAQGVRSQQNVYNDDGTAHTQYFDVANAFSWSDVVDYRDGQGRRYQQSVHEDNGGSHHQYFDVANTQDWQYVVDYYNPAGVRYQQTILYDDGHTVVV